MKSVRRTIRLAITDFDAPDDLTYTAGGRNISSNDVDRFFGQKRRTSAYVARFTLDPRGKYLVTRTQHEHQSPMLYNRRARDYIVVCFIPRGWGGRRVSREAWAVK